ncbi:MAG: L-2-amino-thiazoline-4-carboxylic acid hydrolase [Dehalococcoidales bacterium]|nr:L-2-amino-thiazoline-4-carboxylic acid hydrolase [Dehalococcoidales bacterium]
MADLTDKQIADYLYRGFWTVDGLWFMKVEEKFGFDKALEIDEAVWKVLPKIQARKMMELKQSGAGLEALLDCFTARLKIEGFTFRAAKEGDNGFKIVLESCPWCDVMAKSGRQHLAAKIGDVICPSDYGTWAKEFGCQFELDSQSRICRGSRSCVLHFNN